MNRYEVTLQFDYPVNEDISFLSDEIVNAINTWGSYENITVINARQVSISAEEAIKQIKELKKDFSCTLPSYWNEKLNDILDSIH
jgi:hypothetical protein